VVTQDADKLFIQVRPPNDFGRSRSHGCVNLAPIDARIVFHWASPTVPDHWHAAYAGDQTEAGTLINIHP
jgi:hypothetical protein